MDDAGTRRRTGSATRMPRGRPALAVAGVVAVVAAALLPPGRPAAPPALASVESPLPADPASLDDGFRHLVVSFPDPGPPGGAGAAVRRVPVPEVDGQAEAAALHAVAASGRVLDLRRDEATGGLVATVADGDPVPAPGPGSGPGSDGERVAALEAVPGTQRVTAVGGGHFAVTTSSGRAAYEAAAPGATVADDVVLGVFADPYAAYQWHLRNTGTPVAGLAGTVGADVGADAAWAVTEGVGQVVAVVDTGMEVTHPDLAAAIWSNPGETCGNGVDEDANGFVDDCGGWDFANNDGAVNDSGTNALGQAVDNRHATHIAGIVAAGRDNGVGLAGLAPGARVMPLKVSDTTSLYLSTAAQAIRYAVDNGADVVNCSFGSTGATLAAVRPLQDAVRYAAERGVLVVAAAGNDGRNIDANPTYPASLPEENVVAVGASTNADGPASFSNWGPASVDLFAPGRYIASTLPSSSYGTMSGTSMAAPLVAASAALVRASDPGLGAAAVKERLVTGSATVAALAGRSVAGTRLDVGRIVTAVPEPVTFAFTGLAGAVEGLPVDAGVVASVAATAGAPGSTVAYRATLLTSVDGATFGVSGAEIATGGGPAVTGDDAAVLLSPPGGYPVGDAGRSLPFGVTLPAGDYALVAEAYDPGTGATIGRPWAAFFTVATVGGPAAPPPTVAPAPTTTPTGPAPAPTTAPPTAPAPGPAPTGPTPGPAPTAPTGPAPTAPPPGPGPTPTAPAPTTAAPARPTAPAPAAPAPVRTPTTTAPPTVPGPVRTPTTVAPVGPAPGTTAPPTAPATTTPPATAPPLPPPAPPATDGTLTVTSIGPRYGSTAGGDRVTISGRGFAGTMHVLFGSAPGGAVTVVSATQLLVSTPSRADAGTVGVRVSTGVDSVVLRAAFVYLAPGPGPAPAPAPSPTTTAPVVTSPPPAGAPPTTVPAPAPATPPPPSPTVPAPAPAPPTTTTTVPAVTTSPSRFSFGPAVGTRGSLVLRPVLAPSPLAAYPPSAWPGRRCTAPSCAGVRL